MATYGPGIDQSQHAKSVSHIINKVIVLYCIVLLYYTVVAFLVPHITKGFSLRQCLIITQAF